MQQVDLESLIERCRTPRSRLYAREAVNCYLVGAYRSAIIATWIAVVHDLIDKLRELSLTGDIKAQGAIREFEEIQRARDVEKALLFEKRVLHEAQTEFELITALEAIDLRRLQQDRNRCAHPNLSRDDEFFSPTPELSRSHLRNAVDIVLSHPPVQGKAALGFIHTEIESEYFPTDLDEAERVMRGTPIVRAKVGLIRAFILGAMTSCIREPLTDRKRSQRLAAVAAVRRIFPAEADQIIRQSVDTVFGRLTDQQRGPAIVVIHAMPDLAPLVADSAIQKLRSYVEAMPDAECPPFLPLALELQALAEAATTRLSITDADTLMRVTEGALFLKHHGRQVSDRVLSLYGEVGSFDGANELARKLVRPIIPFLAEGQLAKLISAGQNSQVCSSYGFSNVLTDVKARGVLTPQRFNDELRAVDLMGSHGHLAYADVA